MEGLIWGLENNIIEVDEVHYQSFKLTKNGQKLILLLSFVLFFDIFCLLFRWCFRK